MRKISADKSSSRKRIIVTSVAITAIVAVAAGVMILIQVTQPVAQKSGTTRKSAALVEVVEVFRGDYNPVIVTLGTVEASCEIDLSPQVSGRIVTITENFIPGGFVKEGEVLLEIEADDFRNELAMRESELKQARADLEVEEGRQQAALQEYALLGKQLDDTNRSLVLREPQLRTAEARVAAAIAVRDNARLNLQRTIIRAPFDAQVIERRVNLGSQVSTSEHLAHLVGVHEYWIIASVHQSSLNWISLPVGDDFGAKVQIKQPAVWGDSTFRTGHVSRLIGALDNRTRLARLLITVDDPLSLKSDEQPLLLGTLVETHIYGKSLKDVFRLERSFLRAGDTVWVMKDGKLDIRPVDVRFTDKKFAYLTGGLEDGETVVTTNLATVAQDISLRLFNEMPSGKEVP